MCNSCTVSAAAADNTNAFAARMIDMLNSSAVMLMTSVGHRTGLLDAMAILPASTVSEIARAARLNERYVREWLGAMVTGGIVRFDAASNRYWLPPEHAALLTRASSQGNLGVSAQWVALLGSVENEIVNAFAHGRGVPYSAYGQRFHDVMAEESGQTVIAALHTHIVPLMPNLDRRLTDGLDVLDIGCGKGLALIELAARYPRSHFTGVDLSSDAIAAGRAEAQRRGVTNITLSVGDAATFGVPASFDHIFAFDAIHDQSRPAAVLANIHRLLRRHGTFIMQEIKARTALADNIGAPLAPFIYTVSCMHCMSVSLANNGPGLGAAWGREQALDMLKAAGFARVRVESLPHDLINDYYITGREADAIRSAA